MKKVKDSFRDISNQLIAIVVGGLILDYILPTKWLFHNVFIIFNIKIKVWLLLALMSIIVIVSLIIIRKIKSKRNRSNENQHLICKLEMEDLC